MNNKVYNDITLSPYKLKIKDYTFIFSSIFLREKYERLYKDFVKNEVLKINARYSSNVVLEDLFLLLLYYKVERRGFRVFYKGEFLTEPVSFKVG